MGEETTLAQQLEEMLRGLERALSDAGSAATTARGKVNEIASLERRARELDVRLNDLETAVNRARESLNIPATSSQQDSVPQLRAVPTWDVADEQDEPAFAEGEEEEQQETPAPRQHSEGARCLRLEVEKKIGSLDLKQVDAAVNEIPLVTDVALLDYDGRRATLKLWIGETDDPEAVSETLLKELRSRLGGEAIADVEVAFEDAA
jgi:hypothetical protein